MSQKNVEIVRKGLGCLLSVVTTIASQGSTTPT